MHVRTRGRDRDEQAKVAREMRRGVRLMVGVGKVGIAMDYGQVKSIQNSGWRRLAHDVAFCFGSGLGTVLRVL